MMNKSLCAITLSLLFAIPATHRLEAAPPIIPVSLHRIDTDQLPAARIRIGNVTVTPDITCSTLPGYRPILLDLYRPDGGTARPLVIYLHGGSWTEGSKRATGHFSDFPGLLAGLAQRGFVVASLDYRLSSEARYPAAINDIKAAIRYLRANAKRYGIDPDRIAVWGASAGAHLAAMAAFTGDDLDFEQPGMANAEQSDRVQAFVGWYGPYDLGSMFRQNVSASGASPEQTGPLGFFGCSAQGCPPGVIEQASPVTHVDAGDPPTLLIHGTSDTTVPAEQSRKLNERLLASGVSTTLILIEGVRHDWVGNDHQATIAASGQAVTATFDWLEQTMLKKRDAGKNSNRQEK
jgi:acetyl esterase/lipase